MDFKHEQCVTQDTSSGGSYKRGIAEASRSIQNLRASIKPSPPKLPFLAIRKPAVKFVCDIHVIWTFLQERVMIYEPTVSETTRHYAAPLGITTLGRVTSCAYKFRTVLDTT